MSYGLTEEEWEKLKGSLQNKEGKKGRPCLDLRRTLSGIKWVLKTGCPWLIGTVFTDIFAECRKEEILNGFSQS